MAHHFYDCSKKKPRLLKTITTPAKARKHGKAYPSVTTVLGLLTSEFLDLWKLKKIHELGASGMSLDQALAAMWGTRDCPVTGEAIESSEFGKNAHAYMEAWAKGEETNPYYEPVCRHACDLLADKVILGSEIIAYSHAAKCAGTVDLVVRDDQSGKIEMYDFKFRANHGAYDKDLAQLAIESEWVKDIMGLVNPPSIHSMIVNVETGKAKVKSWKEEDRLRGINLFLSLREVMNYHKDWLI